MQFGAGAYESCWVQEWYDSLAYLTFFVRSTACFWTSFANCTSCLHSASISLVWSTNFWVRVRSLQGEIITMVIVLGGGGGGGEEGKGPTCWLNHMGALVTTYFKNGSICFINFTIFLVVSTMMASSAHCSACLSNSFTASFYHK